ncbi:MAG: FkbM family methyltransferase [Bdellovibrionales bacterium]
MDAPLVLNILTPDELQVTLRGLGRGAHVLQIGAMDGVAFDPVHAMIREMGWRGTLVEPIPDMFDALRANYASAEGLSFVNKAVTTYDGMIEMTRIDPKAVEEAGISKEALGISTTMPDRGVLVKAGGELKSILEKYRRTLSVPCCTMETLLREQKIERVDMLVIDTEGADWMILQQFPIERYRPRIIFFEVAHLTPAEMQASFAHLMQAGYALRVDPSRENILAERK